MTEKSISELYPKYYKDVADLTEIDVYMTHELFGLVDPSGALHHASKKILLPGVRTGGKSRYDDIREARDTLTRWLAIQDVKEAIAKMKAERAGPQVTSARIADGTIDSEKRHAPVD